MVIPVTSPSTSNRILRSFALRAETAAQDALVPAPSEIDNGDEARYPDKSGTYTKCVLQSGIVKDLAPPGRCAQGPP